LVPAYPGEEEIFVSSGFWITWCNLPEQGRDEYLSWMHGSYIPKVLARPGVLSAAHYESEATAPMPRAGRLKSSGDPMAPMGDRYILIVGGKSPHVFVDPTPAEFHATLSDQDRKMLAMRIGASSNIMMIQDQVYGPEGKNRANDMDFSPAIQIGSFNAGSYQDEDELAAWYSRWRLPRSMGTLPGCIQVRKLISISGWAKHACFYEFTSLQARNEKFVNHENFDPAMAEWTDRVVRKLVHAPGLPNVARRIWPPVK
jgi:hypothetical protein